MKQLELNLDPICKAYGCRQQEHFRTIKTLQAVIKGLEAEVLSLRKQIEEPLPSWGESLGMDPHE